MVVDVDAAVDAVVGVGAVAAVEPPVAATEAETEPVAEIAGVLELAQVEGVGEIGRQRLDPVVAAFVCFVGAAAAVAAAVVVVAAVWQTAAVGPSAGIFAWPGRCLCTSCWRGGGDRTS